MPHTLQPPPPASPHSPTTGLRKVTDDMKTYKNPELRASSVVKASELKKPAPVPVQKFGGPSAQPVKPPVCALQGKKWVVVSDKTMTSL